MCLAPESAASVVGPLVAEGLLDLVNVLAVRPGIGGQPFGEAALHKVAQLRAAHADRLAFLMVDGGIGADTAARCAAAGANALVAGTHLFAAPAGRMAERLHALEDALVTHGQ